MINDIDWANRLLRMAENKNVQDLIDWIGTTLETKKDSNGHATFVLKPINSRISKVFVRMEDNQLDSVYIRGDTFLLPFEYILKMTEGYKTSFNTYDAIDDEQFIFYPSKISRGLVGVDSWIDKELQAKPHAEVNFKNVSFYFNKNKVPIHYRDGWYFVYHAIHECVLHVHSKNVIYTG